MDQRSQTNPADPAHELVMEILRTGLMLSDLFSDLFEALPANAFPGEDPAEVLVEMLTGSVRPAVEAAGTEAIDAAIGLMGALRDRAIADLRAAATAASD